MKKLLGLFLVLLLVLAPFVFAAVETSSPDATDIHEINQMTPGSAKTYLGNRLRGLLQRSSEEISAAGIVDLDETVAVTRFVSSASAGTNDPSMDNGYPNQLKTLVLVTDNGQDITITPTTKTGFTSVTLNDAKDSVTLRYVDDTIGWVISGNNGATVN